MKRLPFLTLGLAAAAILVAVIPGATELLQFDRTALLRDGQWFRLFTGHLTHFDADHLRWDVITLLGLGALAERDDRRATVRTLLWAAVGISAAVFALQPQFSSYRGLSGLDSALFGLIVARQFRDGWRARHGFTIAVALLAGIGFALKTGYELVAGDTVFAAGATYAPVPLAHLVGFAMGGAIGLCRHRPSGAKPDPHPGFQRFAVGRALRPTSRHPYSRTLAAPPAGTTTVTTSSP